MSEGQELGNRPAYLTALADWFAEIPDVHERLSRGARVADIGCGGGWSSICIARAYPRVTVDGFDLDEPAVERARRNAEQEGLSDRARFHAIDPRRPITAAGTTSSRRSSASTTCRSPCRCSAPCARRPATTARSS